MLYEGNISFQNWGGGNESKVTTILIKRALTSQSQRGVYSEVVKTVTPKIGLVNSNMHVSDT